MYAGEGEGGWGGAFLHTLDLSTVWLYIRCMACTTSAVACKGCATLQPSQTNSGWCLLAIADGSWCPMFGVHGADSVA